MSDPSPVSGRAAPAAGPVAEHAARPAADPAAEYTTRLAARRASLALADAAHRRTSLARLATFVAGVAIAWLALDRAILPAITLLLPVLAF
ncbi:MAG: hypothetical protein FJ148_29220, partial [Deltaproteobacteria bacterium]|nr:hypothetical protein [Deltaproteobacteria bacterium]